MSVATKLRLGIAAVLTVACGDVATEPVAPASSVVYQSSVDGSLAREGEFLVHRSANGFVTRWRENDHASAWSRATPGERAVSVRLKRGNGGQSDLATLVYRDGRTVRVQPTEGGLGARLEFANPDGRTHASILIPRANLAVAPASVPPTFAADYFCEEGVNCPGDPGYCNGDEECEGAAEAGCLGEWLLYLGAGTTLVAAGAAVVAAEAAWSAAALACVTTLVSCPAVAAASGAIIIAQLALQGANLAHAGAWTLLVACRSRG